jgi:S1-C subfamily serine protease
MRLAIILPLIGLLCACQPRGQSGASAPAASEDQPAAGASADPDVSAPWDVRTSIIRVNSTRQTWNTWQPWEKNPPDRRRALAALIAPMRVVTTAELVADARHLEFESADGSRFTPARVIVVDYEANLALLGPASDDDGAVFFEGMQIMDVAEPPTIGDTLEVLQLEDNGQPILTPGLLQSVTLSSNLLPRHSFLTYLLKASMRSASSSYTLPVLHGRKLAGVLLSYNSSDQLCNVVSTDILARFIHEASGGEYKGLPNLGIAVTRAEDPLFRQWLGLTEEQGGIYVRSVRPGTAASKAGVEKGDVLLAVDGQQISRRGFYEHPRYGSLSWGHLIRGGKSAGDKVTLSLLRQGGEMELEIILERDSDESRLVPEHMFDRAPNYLVKGGLVFQELTRPLLVSFGDDWRSRAPLNLLDAFENPERYEESMRSVVFLSGSIPTPATVGYERLRNLIVHKVNGVRIRDMQSLIHAFDDHAGELHSIEFTDENLTIHLDETLATMVDTQLLERGINRLSRLE